MDPVAATLSWDHRDLGSQTEKTSLDPGDPGSCLCKLSWELADIGCCTTIMPLYREDPLHPMKLLSSISDKGVCVWTTNGTVTSSNKGYPLRQPNNCVPYYCSSVFFVRCAVCLGSKVHVPRTHCSHMSLQHTSRPTLPGSVSPQGGLVPIPRSTRPRLINTRRNKAEGNVRSLSALR